jgi:hypothetical protein
MTTEAEMVIPSGWLQRMTKREFVAFIAVCVAMGSWAYAVQGDIAYLKDRNVRSEAKIEALEKETAQRDKATSITMAEQGMILLSIDARLKFIETNVRKMAQ